MNRFQIFKYRYLIPFIVGLVKGCFGSRNKTNDSSSFFFVLGSGRNGSTLLSTILNNNPEIFIPPEQYVIPFFASKWQLMRQQSRKSFFDELSQCYLQPRKTVNWQMTKEDYEQISKMDSFSSFSGITEQIFKRYAMKVGKGNPKLLGEKSPLSTHYLHLFENEFKDSKFIFLIRDPRDVIFSFSKVPGHKANDLDYAIWKWKDAISQYKRLLNKRKKVNLISYEDLVTNPADVIEVVHEFLEIEYSPNLLDRKYDVKMMGVSQLVHHQNLDKPISPESIGKWRGNLSDSDLSKIQSRLSATAKEFNYDLFD